MKKRVVYSEPTEFIPKEVRKKFKLGEFAEPEEQEKEKANKEIRDYVKNK